MPADEGKLERSKMARGEGGLGQNGGKMGGMSDGVIPRMGVLCWILFTLLANFHTHFVSLD